MRVDFYHLVNKSLEEVLPKLVEKAYDSGQMVKIKIGNPERVETINSSLWTYDEEAFLPHGSAKDGQAVQQPIYLSTEDDNPNKAAFLFLVDGAEASDLDGFERVFNIFNGNDAAALEQARELWKELKNSGAELFYWQQDNSGKWAQK